MDRCSRQRLKRSATSRVRLLHAATDASWSERSCSEKLLLTSERYPAHCRCAVGYDAKVGSAIQIENHCRESMSSKRSLQQVRRIVSQSRQLTVGSNEGQETEEAEDICLLCVSGRNIPVCSTRIRLSIFLPSSFHVLLHHH